MLLIEMFLCQLVLALSQLFQTVGFIGSGRFDHNTCCWCCCRYRCWLIVLHHLLFQFQLVQETFIVFFVILLWNKTSIELLTMIKHDATMTRQFHHPLASIRFILWLFCRTDRRMDDKNTTLTTKTTLPYPGIRMARLDEWGSRWWADTDRPNNTKPVAIEEEGENNNNSTIVSQRHQRNPWRNVWWC